MPLLIVQILVLLAQAALLGMIAHYYRSLSRARRSLDENTVRRQVAREVESLQSAVGALLKEMRRSAQEASRELDEKIAAAEQALRSLERRACQEKGAELPQAAESFARPVPASAEKEPPVQETLAPPSKYDIIYILAGQGLDAAEIARRTQIARGEVELVLGLRGKNR
ncbi:MAG: hypothetical protein IT210_08010 [Armatimonadetes bacterium]|nr:hypothetical protein [Armatimonadota bacterium]